MRRKLDLLLESSAFYRDLHQVVETLATLSNAACLAVSSIVCKRSWRHSPFCVIYESQ